MQRRKGARQGGKGPRSTSKTESETKPLKTSAPLDLNFKGGERAPFLVPVDPGRVTRAKRVESIPFNECLAVPGFEEYVGHVGPYKTRLELVDNNNLGAVRLFLCHVQNTSTLELSIGLLANAALVQSYIEFVEGNGEYRPKTILQKIEALKKAVRWLRISSKDSSKSFAWGLDAGALEVVMDKLVERCNQLRPYAKAEEGRSTQMAYQIRKKQYLSREDFARLGAEIYSWLDYFRNQLDEETRRSRQWLGVAMRFQRLLVTSLFVHIPTPRVKVVATLSLDDIRISGESVHISIGVEKNSFRKLGLKEAVGRQVFLPRPLALHLRHWVLDLLPLVKRQEGKEVWVREDGLAVREQWVGAAVSKTCKNICGLYVTPLSLRRLRTTFAIEAIDELDGRLIDKESMKVELALASGHTREDQEKYYIIKSDERLLRRSKLVTDFTNDLLFGTAVG